MSYFDNFLTVHWSWIHCSMAEVDDFHQEEADSH